MVLKEVFRTNYANSGAINTGTIWHVRPSEEETRMYAPFNIVTIFNDSDEDLHIRFNGSTTDYVVVYSKTVFGTTLDDGKNFYYLDVYNASATNTAANEVRIRIARIKDVQAEV